MGWCANAQEQHLTLVENPHVVQWGCWLVPTLLIAAVLAVLVRRLSFCDVGVEETRLILGTWTLAARLPRSYSVLVSWWFKGG
jgi:hypothetical protein